MGKRGWGRRLRLFITTALLVAAFGFSASPGAEEAVVTTDADIAGQFSLLLGDGDGLTEAYLEKSASRLQAAILSLRLTGKLHEAMGYAPNSNFSDKDLVSAENQTVLGYLKDHPELGRSRGSTARRAGVLLLKRASPESSA